ncbi:MAG: hypothetical protein K9G70_11155 [Prolixibacteraceae bacterium]|nr:hypothetical protein [Prolixibacteraceae bacterium]
MTRFFNILLFFLLVANATFAQDDIFDCNNSKRFANYLYNTGQFELAQHELERLSFFCDLDQQNRLILLKTYRINEQHHKANQFFQTKEFSSIEKLPADYKMEYIRLMMSQQLYGEVKKAIENDLHFPEIFEYRLGIELLQKNWEKAYLISKEQNNINGLKATGLINIANESYQTERKKPWVATLISVVVPGSGKMYSGYWGDGLISFLFTASSSFFAYRAFNKYGADKVYPWIAGGLAVSYYSANIYGSAKAAKRYNDNLNHQYIHETENLLFSDY